jgi:hypothetical protein
MFMMQKSPALGDEMESGSQNLCPSSARRHRRQRQSQQSTDRFAHILRPERMGVCMNNARFQ